MQQQQQQQLRTGLMAPTMAAPQAPSGGMMLLNFASQPALSLLPRPELAAHMMTSFTPKPAETPCLVYVGNLILSITEEQLHQFFGSPSLCPSPASRAAVCLACRCVAVACRRRLTQSFV